jgi:hypothetical protein
LTFYLRIWMLWFYKIFKCRVYGLHRCCDKKVWEDAEHVEGGNHLFLGLIRGLQNGRIGETLGNVKVDQREDVTIWS